ncbi:hypothetical protein [Mesorhizobium sp. NPDC059025]|uniref:hypothetical protein n=1 Tax=unclassified Mesorhizobium TaxID=325217 RepID=UPI0036A131AE
MVYTIEDLKKQFQQQTYKTRTPWTKEDERIVFRGPFLRDVLSKSGIYNGLNIRIIAYDDFTSDILSEEIEQYDPILAVEQSCTDSDRTKGNCDSNQEFRSITMLEKGPIFVVWPFDRLPRGYIPARNSIWVFFPVVLRQQQ